jgi:hypothetical protein
VPASLRDSYISSWGSKVGTGNAQRVFVGREKLSDALISQVQVRDNNQAVSDVISQIAIMSNIPAANIFDYPNNISISYPAGSPTVGAATISVDYNPYYYGTAVVSTLVAPFSKFSFG